MSGRLVILGIDGARKDLFEKYLYELCECDKFYMTDEYYPYLSEFVCKLSNVTEFETTNPPVTVPAWNSLLSGMTPDDIRTYGFYDRAYVSDHFQLCDLSLNNSIRLKDKGIEYLWDGDGYSSNLMNVPCTYPVDHDNGIMVSGILSPELNENATIGYPISSFPRLYKPDIDSFNMRSIDVEDDMMMMREVTDVYSSHRKVASDIFDMGDWDIFTYIDMEVDRVSHQFYGRNESTVGASYINIIRFIIRLFERMNEDDVLVILSDHGIEETENLISIGNVLSELDLYNGRDDMMNSQAWATGGMASRIYLNVEYRDDCDDHLSRDDYCDALSWIRNGVGTVNGIDDDDLRVDYRSAENKFKPYEKPDMILRCPNTRFTTEMFDSGQYEVSGLLGRTMPVHSDSGIFAVVDRGGRFDDLDSGLDYLGVNKSIRGILEEIQ